jgi:hypothetical protein
MALDEYRLERLLLFMLFYYSQSLFGLSVRLFVRSFGWFFSGWFVDLFGGLADLTGAKVFHLPRFSDHVHSSPCRGHGQ